VSQAGASQITFHSLALLAETGAHDVFVEVRSRYFDPRGKRVQLQTFVVDGDDKDFLIGPLFLGDRSAARKDPIFEFRLSLTMKDGEIFTGNGNWIPGTAMRVPIGSHQIERSVGALPAR
jgi:hypothetical protein